MHVSEPRACLVLQCTRTSLLTANCNYHVNFFSFSLSLRKLTDAIHIAPHSVSFCYRNFFRGWWFLFVFRFTWVFNRAHLIWARKSFFRLEYPRNNGVFFKPSSSASASADEQVTVTADLHLPTSSHFVLWQPLLYLLLQIGMTFHPDARLHKQGFTKVHYKVYSIVVSIQYRWL